MKAIRRRFCWVSATASLLGAACWFALAGPVPGAEPSAEGEAASTHVQDLPALILWIKQLAAEDVKLQKRVVAVLARVETKEKIAQGLLDGRVSLLEAGRYFQELDANPSAADRPVFRGPFPGQSEEERRCREAIAYLQIYLHERPALAAQAGLRLKRELARYLEQGALQTGEPSRRLSGGN